jgi:hypothetical protein
MVKACGRERSIVHGSRDLWTSSIVIDRWPESAGEGPCFARLVRHSPTLCWTIGADDYKMAPGLRIPSGSSVFLILCERVITSGPS